MLWWCTRTRFLAAYAPWLRLNRSLFHLMPFNAGRIVSTSVEEALDNFYSRLLHTCDEKAVAVKTEHTVFLPSSRSVNRKTVRAPRVDTTQGGELVLPCISIPNILCTMGLSIITALVHYVAVMSATDFFTHFRWHWRVCFPLTTFFVYLRRQQCATRFVYVPPPLFLWYLTTHPMARLCKHLEGRNHVGC